MIRALIAIVVGSIAGVLLGRMQGSLAASQYEERFAGTIATKAEIKGEFKPEEEVSEGTATVALPKGDEHDFGTMLHGATLSHDFIVQNVGDAPLNLEENGSTCKCTVGEMENNILQPGEETTITLTWTAKTNLPHFGQSASFVTNDPLRQELKFTVHGRVVDSIITEPRELPLGDISATEGKEITFHIFSYFEKGLEFVGFRWTNLDTAPNVSFKVEPADLADFPHHANALDANKVTVTIAPGLPLGPTASVIQFQTSDADKYGIISVPTNGRVVSDVTLIGGSNFDENRNILKMGTVSSAEGASATVFLAIQGNERDNITPEIESWEPKESLQVVLQEPKVVGPRVLVPVKLTVPKGAPAALYPGTSKDNFGKVTIKTDHDTIKEIPIYIRLVVTE